VRWPDTSCGGERPGGRGSQRQLHRQSVANGPAGWAQARPNDHEQVPRSGILGPRSLVQNGQFEGEAWTARHDREGMPNGSYMRRLARFKLITLRNGARQTPRIGTAVSEMLSLNSSKGCVSRSWLPHATGRRPADLARHSSRLPAFRLVQHERDEIGGHLGGISGPGAQWSRAAASTTSRLSRPVSPCLSRLVAGPRGALLLLHALLHCPARKRPSPDWERALTCRN
jgi:hypothetical protein